MKPAPLLLAGSLTANAALFGVLAWQPALAPPLVRGFFKRNFHATDAAPATAPTAADKAHPTEAQPLWTALKSEDLAMFIARLRAAGFPPSVIRELARAEVNARYDARLRALSEPDPNVPFWKQPASVFSSNTKRMEEYSQLQRERSKILRDLFQDDFFATSDVSAAQRRQFGDLPRSTIDQVQRVEDDYAEMISAVRAGMKGITLPEDTEKLALLTREKHTDLAALLSPAELADYEMRSSRITSTLQNRLGSFDASEGEFRAIFQAYQALSEKFPTAQIASQQAQQRQAAQQEFDTQLRASLGDARYADYTRETNSDFQQLNRLVQRDSLPNANAIQAFNLRDTVAQESNRIFDDASLSAPEKRAALESLAQTTRAQLLATLGPTSGPAYVKLADQWLTTVEHGAAVKFNGAGSSLIVTADGSTITFSGSFASYRRLPTPPPGR